MWKKIGLGLLGLLGVLLIVAAVQSPDYAVERSVTINAPAEKIFPYLNSSRRAHEWGPWIDMDPTAQMEYSGPDEGVGSKSSWNASEKLGTGSATITESVTNERVGIQIEYTHPMRMVQQSVYSVRPEGGASVVTWRVAGQNNFVGRFMCLFTNMDKMVGGMFEKGLAKLKNLAEQQ